MIIEGKSLCMVVENYTSVCLCMLLIAIVFHTASEQKLTKFLTSTLANHILYRAAQ